MKRKYESVIILKTQGHEEGIDSMISKVEKQITANGGHLEQIDRLGRKEFAYPSNKISAGYYVNYFFEAEPSAIAKIRETLKLNEDVHVQHYQIAS